MRAFTLRRILWAAACGVVLTAASAALSAAVQPVYIQDLLTRPERYFNTTVTIVAQVRDIRPAAGGGAWGMYSVIDDSTSSPLLVRATKAPRVGKVYRITGTLVADAGRDNAPVLREERRTSPGSSLSSAVLIAAGLILAALGSLGVFLWLKPGRRSGQSPRIRPAGEDMAKTIRIAPAPQPAAPDGAKTQVFRNLGASLVLESGPDKGREYPLHLMRTSLGRPGGRLNDIEIADATVSKEQASILYDSTTKEFTLVNESATNPTLLDGAEIAGPAVLKSGAAIAMGKVGLTFKAG
jgi:hypothetical protein